MNDLKEAAMRLPVYGVFLTTVLLTACSLTQKPVSVSEGGSAPPQAAVTPLTEEHRALVPAKSVAPVTAPTLKQPLPLAALVGIAKSAQQSPQAAKKYSGERLVGQAKFIKTPRGNPNAVVADVRVNGLGEVSLWCRNVIGAAPAGRILSFEGTLTGSVYTAEDFSHDVTMKDCRFQE